MESMKFLPSMDSKASLPFSDEKRKTYQAILKTVFYADIFDYPLTEEEVYRFISPILKPRESTRGDIKKANGVIRHKDNFMFLKGQERLIGLRKKKEEHSRKKLLIAKRIASILKHIPTIKLVGVSGSVAIGNADKHHDIDFFIITSTGTLWFTRLLTTIAVELFGKRRRPGDTDVTDKICLNMFVDERFLAIAETRRNLYTAHDVCQLKVLFDRDNTYERFLAANEWVRKFLPNAVSSIRYQVLGIRRKQKNTYYIIHAAYYILEWLAKHLQLWYMRKRLTTETITDGYLAFHPKDYTKDVLSAFQERVRYYASQI